jgi:dipeptidyl aminopeptidase/acylaminoacyl peptidase
VPYLLLLSDGPGEQHPATLEASTAFFTSRGLGVVDVHGRGSSGYGRTYREHVYGQWGVADVEDCAVVARNLVAGWDADPARLVVRGVGTAAATALAVIASTDVCAAATVYGATTDLAAIEGERGRYLREIAADSLLLRTPAWLDRVRRPVLICHDEDDTLVPRRQATLLRDALRSNAVPHAWLGFRGKGDGGLRRADAVAEALEAELSFYGQVLGFEPPETAHLDLVAGGQESRPGVGRPGPSASWGHR